MIQIFTLLVPVAHRHVVWMMFCLFKWCMRMEVEILCRAILYYLKIKNKKSQLYSSGSDEYLKKHSIAVIKRWFYMGSSSDVTPLLGDGRFINIDRKKFIQMDGLMVKRTYPFYFTIKASMYV